MYTERRYKKRLHRNRPFLLLGNEVDGQIFCKDTYTFRNLSGLKKTLLEVISNIKGEGEWIFELYQVPEDYKIWHRWGYYKYPNHGTKLYTYNYMSPPMQEVKFYKNELSFVGARVGNFPSSKADVEVQIDRLIWELNSR